MTILLILIQNPKPKQRKNLIEIKANRLSNLKYLWCFPLGKHLRTITVLPKNMMNDIQKLM